MTFYGSGVHRFTLDPSLGEFIHIEANVKIPTTPKVWYRSKEYSRYMHIRTPFILHLKSVFFLVVWKCMPISSLVVCLDTFIPSLSSRNTRLIHSASVCLPLSTFLVVWKCKPVFFFLRLSVYLYLTFILETS